MPIISRVEAKSLRGRLTYLGIILFLCITGTMMIYPFLIMVSGSFRSNMDVQNLSLIPKFLVNVRTLDRKFLETKYDDNPILLNYEEHQFSYSFRKATIPKHIVLQRVKDLQQFVQHTKIPHYWWNLGGLGGYRMTPKNLRELRNRLVAKFHGNITALGRAMGTPMNSWNEIVFNTPQWLSQRFNYAGGPIYDVYFKMLRQSPLAERQILSLSGDFTHQILVPDYGRHGVAKYNKHHTHKLASLDNFILPPTVPGKDQPTLRKEWISYVYHELNPAFVMLKGVNPRKYQSFLKVRHGTIQKLNDDWQTHYVAFSSIKLPKKQLLTGAKSQDYLAFMKTCKPEHYQLVGFEYAWRNWLRQHYHHNIHALNKAEKTHYARFADAKVPMPDLELHYVTNHAGSLRWRYAVRNYINVFDALFFHGRALANTVIYCGLAILLALLINPLAAYAMSRFRLPGTYKILLILMATMAFPPMVTMIPMFLMLRHLDLLNTFAALLLPTAANGYLIFLLKGFFDSLPQELYEAARIDGASEMRMFVQLTLALSKPIMAWVALMAFQAAYMSFLYPLIVCPNPHMWILAVWLYQFQNQASSAAIYASILIASIPAFLVFLFAQRTIMRGIVVPVEK